MRRTFVAAGAVAAICALSSGLAGCGKLGSLERPGPMFGHPSAAARAAPSEDPNRPVQTHDPREQSNIPGQDQPPPVLPTGPTPRPQ
ncbi:MAG: hypothetical protein JWP50_1630 [Phenylobacterium sp.]|nr:hypothetical protein [Phenylobacterium sp.]